jgi:DMSO reductase family type II enzyme molybdopterin subunit
MATVARPKHSVDHAPVTEARHRDRFKFDRAVWASHCIDCYPGNCPYRVYLRDGKIAFEEQAGTLPVIEAGVPDMNPMGCQKGAGWSHTLTGGERLRHPAKRIGERGSGEWQRISWEQACNEIADGIIDAIQDQGPESMIALSGCNMSTWGATARGRFFGQIGGLTTDLNAEMNDFSPGHYLTYGKFDPVSSTDDWFHADVFFIWFSNPAYTRIPHQHFITEARYRGATIVTVAPDYSPSAMHADYYVGVKPGTDAAFALGMAATVIEEGLVHEKFVKDQTDLPLLVRDDNERLLVEADLKEGGHAEQFFWLDLKTKAIAPAPRDTLKLGKVDPALTGKVSVTLKDGSKITASPVYGRMVARLKDYTPEKASVICGVDAGTIRELGRKVARGRTKTLGSLNNAGKYYHGDLIERSQLLLLALTGNWGRKGTGVQAWVAALFDGWFMSMAKPAAGPEMTKMLYNGYQSFVAGVRAEDPTMTQELATIEFTKRSANNGATGWVPPVFLWYNHAGFKKNWNQASWHDESMPRTFDSYYNEALKRGWWAGVPGKAVEPRVFIECGGNALRRTRGGRKMLVKHLWPKLKTIATIDYRMSATALESDYALPMAAQYEKISFGIPSTHTLNLTFCDKVVEPIDESKSELEIFGMLSQAVERRAKARNFLTYKDGAGVERRLDDLYQRYSFNNGYARNGNTLIDEEALADEMIKDTIITGALPEGSGLDTVRDKGFIRFTGLGMTARAQGQASDIEPDSTFTPFRNHTEKKYPYPTLTRRAQFYIDHDWFLEADEHLPRHKEPPKAGGDYPLLITSGHNRWSLHSVNIVNKLMLQTHRGEPHLVMNPSDAAARDLEDNEVVEVFNDVGSYRTPIKTSPSARPGQIIMYNGWEPYQFPNWNGPSDIEPGMIKPLHLAGGYGHLKYWPNEWQPAPACRGTRADVRKITV